MNDIAVPQMPANMPASMAIYFDDRSFERASAIATRMSKAEGFTPAHLIGKPDACFAVVEISLTWRLSPFQVAKATYKTPGGAIGFEGKLIQAIIENSGHLEPGTGGVHFEHYGDWSKIQGKFVKREGKEGRKYDAPAWTDEDAIKGGAGVLVWAHMRGESKPRELRFDLVQAQPRNSTLWATDAKTQLCYTAVRRFGSVVVPGLLMGVPFEDDLSGREIDMGDAVLDEMPSIRMPQPKRAEPEAPSGEALVKAAKAAVETTSAETVDHETGEVHAPKAATSVTDQPMTSGQIKILRAKMEQYKITEDEILQNFGVALEKLPFSMFSAVQEFITPNA